MDRFANDRGAKTLPAKGLKGLRQGGRSLQAFFQSDVGDGAPTRRGAKTYAAVPGLLCSHAALSRSRTCRVWFPGVQLSVVRCAVHGAQCAVHSASAQCAVRNER
mgnify:CR=1 FL=1